VGSLPTGEVAVAEAQEVDGEDGGAEGNGHRCNQPLRGVRVDHSFQVMNEKGLFVGLAASAAEGHGQRKTSMPRA
jgi:hypothetical protein